MLFYIFLYLLLFLNKFQDNKVLNSSFEITLLKDPSGCFSENDVEHLFNNLKKSFIDNKVKIISSHNNQYQIIFQIPISEKSKFEKTALPIISDQFIIASSCVNKEINNLKSNINFLSDLNNQSTHKNVKSYLRNNILVLEKNIIVYQEKLNDLNIDKFEFKFHEYYIYKDLKEKIKFFSLFIVIFILLNLFILKKWSV